MADMRVRRNRGFAVPQYQPVGKAEKQTNASQVRQAPGKAASLSDTLRQLVARVSQAEGHVQQARRTLQTGESILAEVQEGLKRMADLAQRAAHGEGGDALQAELEQLRAQVERVVQSGTDAGLFLGGDMADNLDALLDAAAFGLDSRQDGMLEGVPSWLLWGMADNAPDKAALLEALGLDSSATGAELVAALGRLPLEDSPAAGYLAALYLGSVIAGGGGSGTISPTLAAEGLRQLLEAIAQGSTPDEAVSVLSEGEFSSLSDFQAQLAAGSAPGLESFLMDILLAGDASLSMPSILALLAGGNSGMEGGLSLLMGLLAALEKSGTEQAAVASSPAPAGEAGAQSAQTGIDTPPQAQVLEAGNAQVTGRSLEHASYSPQTGVLTLDGPEDVVFRGLAQPAPALQLNGTGTVTLRQADVPQVAVGASVQARVEAEGDAVLAQVQLGKGAAFTLGGTGTVRIDSLRGGPESVLRLAGGAFVLADKGQEAGKAAQTPEALPVPVVIAGAASLLASRSTPVFNPQGQALQPFDLMWKALLPNWNAITAMAVDGEQAKFTLMKGTQSEHLRLWLLQNDPSHGYPAHSVVLQGRDEAGRLQTRYVYLCWSQREGAFQEVPLYPNPFTVTGGEPDRDWRYEEETQTLRILTSEVSALSGGPGTDANQEPFSGRVALADAIGPITLSLDGVVCQVPSGRAFALGRGNQVALLLGSGSQNIFESGPGCAGITLGDGTSLRIDQAENGGNPVGRLHAVGGSGSPGIGRDSGVGRERTGSILICTGHVTATRGKSGKPQAKGAPPTPSLPQFHVSPQSLHLAGLDLSTREAAQAALESLSADRRWVARLQEAYGTMHGRLERDSSGLNNIHRYIHAVRDANDANDLLQNIMQQQKRETAPKTPGRSLRSLLR